MNKVHFSSKSEDWETPQDLFDRYNKIFNFKLDLCASFANRKCSSYICKEMDSLKYNWQDLEYLNGSDVSGNFWLNPPYGRQIKDWIKKAYEASLKGKTIVCLLPARTDTHWWHEYCMKGEIHFIKGRLKFNKHKNSAPFPSAVVIFYGFLRKIT